MQWMIISTFLLVTWEFPVLHAKKVVVMLPRQVRRSHPFPWPNALMMMQAKKNAFFGQGSFNQRYGYPLRPDYYSPKRLRFAKNQFPQGGDDFDQGHEEVNNVIVPHGRGITHAVSFGNGYIPYGSYKDTPTSYSHHHDYKLEDQRAQTFDNGAAVDYPNGLSQTEPFISQQADAYFDNEYPNRDELQDRIQGHGTEKFVVEKSPHDSSNDENIERHYGTVQRVQGINNKVGAYLLSGNGQYTPDGNKQGIVLRDSIVLDDYNRKIAELTKSWPSSFSSTNLVPRAIGPSAVDQGTIQQHGVSRQFDGTDTFTGLSRKKNFLSTFREAQSDQGYAVKEDIVDAPHDFRTMPIRTAPAQTHQKPILQIRQQQQQPPPLPNFQHQQPLQHIIYQQPVPGSIQHIFTQTQLPLHRALPDYQAYIHG